MGVPPRPDASLKEMWQHATHRAKDAQHSRSEQSSEHVRVVTSVLGSKQHPVACPALWRAHRALAVGDLVPVLRRGRAQRSAVRPLGRGDRRGAACAEGRPAASATEPRPASPRAATRARGRASRRSGRRTSARRNWEGRSSSDPRLSIPSSSPRGDETLLGGDETARPRRDARGCDTTGMPVSSPSTRTDPLTTRDEPWRPEQTRTRR